MELLIWISVSFCGQKAVPYQNAMEKHGGVGVLLHLYALVCCCAVDNQITLNLFHNQLDNAPNIFRYPDSLLVQSVYKDMCIAVLQPNPYTVQPLLTNSRNLL